MKMTEANLIKSHDSDYFLMDSLAFLCRGVCASIPSLESCPPRLPKDTKSISVSALHHKRRRRLRIEKVGIRIELAGKRWGWADAFMGNAKKEEGPMES